MRKIMLGDIIRSLRKQAGLSQEDLADGICSAVSISRIENGVQMPSSAILDKILCKLGTGTYQIRNIYYKNEKQLAFEEDAHAVKSIISQNRLFEAKQKLVVLKDLMQDDISNMQYYILLASSIKLYENRNISELIPELKAAIKLTKNDFNT